MNINILLNNLGNSDMSYKCLEAVESGLKNPQLSFYIFYKNLLQPVKQVPCFMMNIAATSHMKDIAIATDLTTLELLKKNNSNITRYYYCWDLEWLYSPVNYSALISLLDGVKIIARSESHRDVISNLVNGQNIDIVKDFNIGELITCLK